MTVLAPAPCLASERLAAEGGGPRRVFGYDEAVALVRRQQSGTLFKAIVGAGMGGGLSLVLLAGMEGFDPNVLEVVRSVLALMAITALIAIVIFGMEQNDKVRPRALAMSEISESSARMLKDWCAKYPGVAYAVSVWLINPAPLTERHYALCEAWVKAFREQESMARARSITEELRAVDAR